MPDLPLDLRFENRTQQTPEIQMTVRTIIHRLQKLLMVYLVVCEW